MQTAHRIPLADELNFCASQFSELARRVTPEGLSPSDQIENDQAEINAGAVVWQAVIDGGLTDPELVEEVRKYENLGLGIDTASKGYWCANLFFEAARVYYYPQGDAFAPYVEARKQALRQRDARKLDDSAIAEYRQELRNHAKCCLMLAELIKQPPANPYADLLACSLGPLARKIVEAICESNGMIKLAELAKIAAWEGEKHDINNAYQAAKTRINKIIQKKGWSMGTEGGTVRISKNPNYENTTPK